MNGADLATFQKVKALHDRAASPGERAAAASRLDALAKAAGMTTSQALSKVDAVSQPSQAQQLASAFDAVFNTPEEKARRADRERKRLLECERLRKEWGSEAEVFADTPIEAAMRRACTPLLGKGQTWTMSYTLAGWCSMTMSASKMPASVRAAVSAASPLPTTVAGAWAEFQAAEKLMDVRCTFEPDYNPHAFVEARRHLVEELLNTLPARGYGDLRARLDWFDYVNEQEVEPTVEDERALRRTLRADIERMAEIVKKATAAARAPVSETGTVHHGRLVAEVSARSGENSRFPISGLGPGPAPIDLSPPVSASATVLPTAGKTPDPGAAAPHRANPTSPSSLRRTNVEKRQAVLALFGQGLADREVARRAGVSPQMVGNVRKAEA